MLSDLSKLIALLLVILYTGMGIYLYVAQRSFLYHPTKEEKTGYPTMTLQQEDASVNVIVLNGKHDNAILYFGGNAESLPQSSDYIAGQFPGFTVYLMEYRSYGGSTGKPSEEALYADALKLYDTVKSNHTRISVGGRSLGTAIATYVAAHREVSKLALITPFDSIVNVAKERYPIYPVSLLLHDKFDSASRAAKITAETLIVIAENDSIVSAERTQKLIEAFDPEHLHVETIKGRGHNDISSDERYYKMMQAFIAEG